MNGTETDEIRVLAIDPTTRGFGFAVMEGPESLIDWGVKDAGSGNKNARCLELVSDLIEHYLPDTVVVEDFADEGSRRSHRVQELIGRIEQLAAKRKIKVSCFSRSQTRVAFSRLGASTKHQIATAIAAALPELAPRLPPYRHPWMPEDYRMAVFDAVALALTFFHLEAQRQKDALLALGINSSNHAK